MLNFRYAELSDTGKRWFVYYYVVNPATGFLERKRIYLNRLRSRSNKIRYAKRLIDLINEKIDQGWNPFITEKNHKQYTNILEALDFVKKYKFAYVREKTKPQYKQRLKEFTDWLIDKKYDKLFVFDFDESHAIDFMNYLLLERRISGCTFNNYLIDYRGFFNLLMKLKYISSNPFKAVSRLPELAKRKQPFTYEQQRTYRNYVLKHDFDFYVVSMYCYYCAIRPNEIVQLRIGNVDLTRGTIIVPAEVSKNKKQRMLPVADVFLEQLRKYLKGKPADFFLCSKNFKPGVLKIAPTRIAEHFREIANRIGLPRDVFFYSLKDTCADRLIEAGFSIKTLRDLFGHSDISVTDQYLRGINVTVDKRLRTEFPEF